MVANIDTSPTSLPKPSTQPRPEFPAPYDSAPPGPASLDTPPTPYTTSQESSGVEVSGSTGHPTSPQGTPWAPPLNVPPLPPPGSGPYTPAAAAWPLPPGDSPYPAYSGEYSPWQPQSLPSSFASTPPPGWPAPAGYNAFNQPLSGGVWPSTGSYTPGYPTSIQGTPWAPPLPLPPLPPLSGSGPVPAAIPTVPPPASNITHPTLPAQGVSYPDRVDPFAEGPHYGPVLEPFLAKILGAVIKLNPLIAPPFETPDDYIRWDMLFHTNKCYRTTELTPTWIKGRDGPATHPRLTHIHIISRAFPWVIHVHAEKPELGVTCGEVLDAISASMYENIAKKEFETLDPGKKRQILDSYKLNRSMDSNAPGGRLGEGLKRLDWLGSESRFGGLVANDAFVGEHFGDVLPCTFELKCLSSGLIRKAVIRQDHWEKYVRRKEPQV